MPEMNTFMSEMNTTYLVPEAHKYKQNKTGNTDTDYEYIIRKKQELRLDLGNVIILKCQLS